MSEIIEHQDEATEQQEVKILIGTPMYGGMCTGTYCYSLANAVITLASQGVKVGLGMLANESLIPRARNELARACLEGDFTHLMFIDADIGFPAEGISALLKADRDIACGIYPKKEIDWKRVKQAASGDKENLQDYSGVFVLSPSDKENSVTDDAGMVEVRNAGAGFMLIKRRVLEELQPHVPTYKTSGIGDHPLVHEFFATSIAEDGVLLSEDFHFCELWRKHGGKVYVNPFIQLSHTGSYIYTGNILAAGVNVS